MSEDKRNTQARIDHFRRLYHGHQGGIFRKKTRERILTGKGIPGRGRKKNQFWYRHRENVKTALIDLQLFIEMAGDNNVNQVINEKALSPIAHALFLHPRLKNEDPNLNRAEIAELFIKLGFKYLSYIQKEWMTRSHQRTKDEAIDLSSYLVMYAKLQHKSAYST